MFNISPCAQAYIEIQLSNLSPWHIPISSQRDPTHGSPRTQQVYLPLSAVRQSHVTRGQHISAPQGTAWTEPPCSAHPWHLSLHYSSERLEQPKPQQCWWEGIAGVFRPAASERLEHCQYYQRAGIALSVFASKTSKRRSHTDLESLEWSQQLFTDLPRVSSCL